MKKFSKIFAILLALALMISGIAIVVAAEGNEAAVVKFDSTETEYATLTAALTAAEDGDTVKLLTDVSAESTFTIDKSVTLDLNGKSLSVTGAHAVASAANVSVKVKNGSICATGTDKAAIYREGDAKIAVENCTLEAPLTALSKASATGTVADGTYHLVITNSQLIAGGGFIKSTVPNNYTSNTIKDTDWIVYKSKQPYHWVNIGEGGASADAVETRYVDASGVIVEEGTEGAVEQELIPGLPYHYVEIKVEGSELVYTGGGAGTVFTSDFLTHKTDDGSAVVNQSVYASERHSMTNAEFDGCYIETGYSGFFAYSSEINIYNTVAVFNPANKNLFANSNSSQVFFSNGLVHTENSAFIFPNYTTTSTSNVFRLVNSGGAGNFSFGEGTYFSGISSSLGKINSGASIKALDAHGISGYVFTTQEAAYVPDCLKSGTAAARGLAHMAYAPGVPGKQDFDNTLAFFIHNAAAHASVMAPDAENGDSMTWTLYNLDVDAGQGLASLVTEDSGNTYFRFNSTYVNGGGDSTAPTAYEQLYKAVNICFGIGYNDRDLTAALNHSTKYNAVVGLEATDGTPVSAGEYYVSDFELSFDKVFTEFTLAHNTLDANGASAIANAFAVTADGKLAGKQLSLDTWYRVTLITKIVGDATYEGSVTALYIDGEYVASANTLTAAASRIAGFVLSAPAGSAAGAVNLDNIISESYAQDYTALDALFAQDGANLANWQDAENAAKIGDVAYYTLNAAIAAAQQGDTVTIIKETCAVPVIETVITIERGDYYFSYISATLVSSEENGTVTFAPPAADLYLEIIWHDSEAYPTKGYYRPGNTITYDGPVLSRYTDDSGIVMYFAGWATSADASVADVINSYPEIMANDLGTTINYYPIYYSNALFTATSGSTVTAGYSYDDLSTAVKSAADGTVITLLNDILIAVPGDSAPTLSLPTNKTVYFDFNGYDIIRDLPANSSGGARKGQLFTTSAGSKAYIYSSKPGAEYYSIGIFVQVNGNESTVLTVGSDGVNDYGDNLGVYCAVAYSAQNATNIVLRGCIYDRRADYRALIQAEKSTNIDAKGCIFRASGSPFLYLGTYNDSDASKQNVTINASFENCVFIGNNSSSLFYLCQDSFMTADAPEGSGTYVEFTGCEFYNVKFSANTGDITGHITVNYGNLLSNCIFEGAAARLVPMPEGYVKAYASKTSKTVTFNSPEYVKDGSNITFTYADNGKPLQISTSYELSENQVIVAPESVCNVTWSVGAVEITEQWCIGEIPTPQNASVVAALEMLERPGGYKYVFETEALTGDALYAPVYYPVFDVYANLVASNRIDLNFYIPAGVGVYEFKLGEKVYTIDPEDTTRTVVNGMVCYMITVKDIKPQALCEAIDYELFASVVVSETDIKEEHFVREFSLTSYFESIITSDEYSEAQKALVKSVAAYIDAAYVLFGTTGNEGYAALHALTSQYPTGDSEGVQGEIGSMTAVAQYVSSACLNLENRTAIRFYVSDISSPITFEYAMDGVTRRLTVASAEELSQDENGKMYVDIALPVYEFDNTVTVTVGEAVGTYNLATYAASTTVAGNQSLKALTDAIGALIRAASAQ